MLENSVYLDGSQGKKMNQLFEQYNSLGVEIDDLTASRKAVAEQIKSVCNQPLLYETTEYTLRMKSKPTVKETIDKNLLRIKYPDVYADVLKFEELPAGVNMGTPKKK